ncbi:hypothetical protein PNOK_0816200 [Pyrrhoderma noxium]|uniref:Uncharacterized protein n=1 Tax=Pyrrhoderma noxium TaxID=2282107 RepID=A0A286UAD2_9AGAM|nr:hypothetical protein PNOK_0816200 [Pyrrhoderma noxium]
MERFFPIVHYPLKVYSIMLKLAFVACVLSLRVVFASPLYLTPNMPGLGPRADPSDTSVVVLPTSVTSVVTQIVTPEVTTTTTTTPTLSLDNNASLPDSGRTGRVIGECDRTVVGIC